MKRVARLAALGLASIGALAATGAADPSLPSVPSGFRIAVFATQLGKPRGLAIDPVGTLLASIPNEGRVVALPDRGRRGVADDPITVAHDLHLPHGLAFHRGALYVAETGRVRRFRWDPAGLTASDAKVVVDGFPAGEWHWTRTVAVGPDGNLYLAIGSTCDVCRERDARRAAIVRYGSDGGNERLVASGLRNPVGLAFEPRTGTLWTAVNERDWKSGGAPPDYVTAIKDGASYGWPDCYALNGTFTPDPEFRGTPECRGFTTPTLELPPHSAPLGLAFYTGRQFPASYRGNLFVALHGSRPELPRAGYKIIRLVIDANRVVGVEDFSIWWNADRGTLGRPVDMVVGRDGALYVSDDHAGRIYRVTWGSAR